MSNKALAVVCYCTIIGWYVAFAQYQNTWSRSTLVAYHLKQSLGLTITSAAIAIVLCIAGRIIHIPAIVWTLAWALVFMYAITGIIYAARKVRKPLPLIGTFFSKRLNFIFPDNPQQQTAQQG